VAGIKSIQKKLQGLTASEIAGEAILRARRAIAHAASRASSSIDSAYVSDDDLKLSLNGRPVSEIAERLREPGRISITAGISEIEETARNVREFYPESVEQTIEEAERVLTGRVQIFDHWCDVGRRVDWLRDPLSGTSWPLEHFTRVRLHPRTGADVRVVWELNRLHHLMTLGRAYALTKDERYTDEFLIQVALWIEQNPPGFGVNWVVAMEAAIRVINVLAAFEMLRLSPSMTDEAVALILKMIIAHGEFISSNLEYSHVVTSNHYLADLIGLFAIGLTVPELKQSQTWASQGAEQLLREMRRQILPDGVDYEGSTAYHRLVLEIYALFFGLSRQAGIEIPADCWERLEAMFDFSRHYLKPDGNAPVIGDSDDGRLIKFRTRPPTDHSYLMSLAALLLEQDRFKQSNRLDEEALWWFGAQGREAFESLAIDDREISSHGYTDAQIFIQRAGPLYSIIDCGDHGAGGRGSHAHSDALSFELYAFDQTFLRDPGTFLYNASERWRNRFRSTAYHNTARVDGRDISHIEEGELFSLGPNVRPVVNLWEATPERDVLDAEHNSYEGSESPVIHRRVMTFDKLDGYWIIEDLFAGKGEHDFEFFFNFDAGIEFVIEEGQRVVARSRKAALAIVPATGHTFEMRTDTRWVSPSYGTRLRSSGIIYRLIAGVPFESMFLLVPFRPGQEEKVQRIQEATVRA
jgi:hypothetical protein